MDTRRLAGRDNPAGSTSSRLIELDILRGVAILLVLGAHPVFEPQYAGRLRPLGAFWQRVGWTGVDLFFVLSGFLVGGLLLEELRRHGRIDIARFLLRRALRIYPVFIVYVAYLIAWVRLAHPRESWLDAVCFLWPLYATLQNYLGSPRFHLWSLAVEEHFYLTLPLVLMIVAALYRRPARLAVPLLCIALMAASLALRVRHCLSSHYNPIDYHVWTKTHLRLDGLALGVLLAFFYHYQPLRWERLGRISGWLLVLGLALIVPVVAVRYDVSIFTPTIGLTLLYLGYGCLLVGLLTTRGAPQRWCHARPGRGLAWVGYASYPIYLWHIDLAHQPLVALIGTRLLWPLGREMGWLVATAVYVALAVGIGAFMGWLLEKPLLCLRDRWLPARAAAVTVAHPEAATEDDVSPVAGTLEPVAAGGQ